MLNKIKPKHIIVGAIGFLSVSAALLYWQYKKVMEYKISIKGVSVNKLTLRDVDFNLFLNFLNPSNLKFTIKNQTYLVYINDIYVTTLQNNSPTEIAANSTSVIGLNVKLSPNEIVKAFQGKLLDMLKAAADTKIKLDIKMKMSLYGIPISIPFVYESTVKEMVAASKDKAAGPQ